MMKKKNRFLIEQMIVSSMKSIIQKNRNSFHIVIVDSLFTTLNGQNNATQVLKDADFDIDIVG